MNGFQQFYYTRELPARSVAIAKVKSAVHTPADLTDVLDIPYLSGNFEVRDRYGVLKATAPDVGASVSFSGDTMYRVGTQFFQLTNIVDANSLPLYSKHKLPDGATNVTVRDEQSNILTERMKIVGNVLYHDLADGVYWITYVDRVNRLLTEMLKFTPVLAPTEFSAGQGTYVFNSLILQVATDVTYWIRFTSTTGYRVLPPYEAMPNVPWFARLRFTPGSLPQEYARQVFLPERPYMLGTWVPGTVLDKNVLQLSRPQMFDNPEHRPDILVFDRDNAIKYALEGTLPGTARRRGAMYPWRRGQILDVDAYTSRVQVAVELADDDIVFGFYAYRESDVLYTGLDLNPYTNPVVRNRTVKFYFKNTGSDPFTTLYHQVLDETQGDLTKFLLKDPWASKDFVNSLRYVGGAPANVAVRVEGGRSILQLNKYNWVVGKELIAFDPTKLYRMTIKYRQSVATANNTLDAAYVGVEGYAADGVTLVASNGSAGTGSQHYLALSGKDMTGLSTWQTAVAYFKGNSAAGSNGGGASTAVSPYKLHTNVRYFKPLIVCNYISAPDGQFEVDTFTIEVVDEYTNDPTPSIGVAHPFGYVCVGATVGTENFEVSDERVRGGGLLPKYHDIPQASSFWDIGHWDGKPYPLAGVLAIYLPKSILDRMSAEEVKAKVEKALPLGTLPLLRFLDEDGQEWIA